MRIPVDTVLFDFDGTLAETALDFERMRREVLALAAHYGPAPSKEMYVLEAIAHVQQQLIARDPEAARAFGQEAERIISLAKSLGIPIKEDPDLITILSKVELGQEIPEEIYALVAEILSFVYNLNNDWPDA